MKKRLVYILVIILSLSLLSGCGKDTYGRYEDSFFDTFDTITQVVGYAESEEEFEEYMDKIHSRFSELHKLYDRYNSYEGINNIKTINDNAGIKPVRVEDDIIDLIEFSLDWYHKTGEETNIAMGPVIDIWTKYSEISEKNPENASIPSMDELEKASKYTDIDKIIVNQDDKTVYLEDPNMSLDLGGIAKGYAVEIVALEIEEEGLKSVLISGGGDIRAIGKPLEDRKEKWGIGIQNPDTDLIDTGNILETIFIKNSSIVSSGDYQRYFTVNDKKYHHIIDPKTLMPGDYYRAITIVTPDTGVADFLSTSAFLLPFDESKELIDSFDDVEALWVMKDGGIRTTKGMEEIMLSEGATGGKSK